MNSLTRILLGFVFVTVTAAFAADNRGSLHISRPVMVGKSQLPAGEYTVQWEGSGPDIELKVMQGNRIKAAFPARLVALERPYDQDAAVFKNNDDGSRSLIAIHFSKKKFALDIQSTADEVKSSLK